MKNNKMYLVLICVLIVIVVFLIILLFVKDSGKYCAPVIKEKTHFPVTDFSNDSLKMRDSVNSEYELVTP